MWGWGRTRRVLRPRDAIVVLTLLSHLFATFGFPLLSPAPRHKRSSTPYPCQSRPCGCLTSEQCWAGDCCCFTLADKLAWAEENGVAPPEHVRPLVESRRPRPAPPKKKPCCAESEPAAGPAATAEPACCERPKPLVRAGCCEKPAGEVAPKAECPQCAAKPEPGCCEKKTPTADRPGVRWVVGIFAQKCRGEGPAGLFQLDPAVVPDLTPLVLAGPDRGGPSAAPRSERVASLTHAPPTRPPRSS